MDRRRKHRSSPGEGACSWTVVSLLTCLLANGIVITTQTLNYGYFSFSARKNVIINEQPTTAHSEKQKMPTCAKVKDYPIAKKHEYLHETEPPTPPSSTVVVTPQQLNITEYTDLDDMFKVAVQYTPFAMKLLLTDRFTMDGLTTFELRQYSLIHNADGSLTHDEYSNGTVEDAFVQNATVVTAKAKVINGVENKDTDDTKDTHRPTKYDTKLETDHTIYNTDPSLFDSNHKILNDRPIRKPRILHTAIDGEYIHCRVYTAHTKPSKHNAAVPRKDKQTKHPVVETSMPSPDVGTRCLIHHAGINATRTDFTVSERTFVSCTSGKVQNGVWTPAETIDDVLPSLDSVL